MARRRSTKRPPTQGTPASRRAALPYLVTLAFTQDTAMTMTLPDLAKKMRSIDFTMLTTRAANGQLAGRPMSNNGDVEYDGDSYFFSYDSAHTIADIERDPTVGLVLQGSKGLLGAPPLMIAIEAQAELIRDKAAFKEHWTPELDRWFPQGVETPGVVLIKAHASRVHYWDGEDEGEIRV